MLHSALLSFTFIVIIYYASLHLIMVYYTLICFIIHTSPRILVFAHSRNPNCCMIRASRAAARESLRGLRAAKMPSHTGQRGGGGTAGGTPSAGGAGEEAGCRQRATNFHICIDIRHPYITSHSCFRTLMKPELLNDTRPQGRRPGKPARRETAKMPSRTGQRGGVGTAGGTPYHLETRVRSARAAPR